jgi:hypothetical protein
MHYIYGELDQYYTLCMGMDRREIYGKKIQLCLKNHLIHAFIFIVEQFQFERWMVWCEDEDENWSFFKWCSLAMM